jgi:glucosylglycerate synthase
MSEPDSTQGSPGIHPAPAPPEAAGRRPFLLAVQGRLAQSLESARTLSGAVQARFPSVEPVVLIVERRGGETTLVPVEAAGQEAQPGAGPPALVPAASQGAVLGHDSPLGPLLREGAARDAVGMAIVAAEPHDAVVDWVDRLLAPVIEGGFDFVCPAYRRHRTDGAINIGIVSPLMQTLYGQELRQPLGTEGAISGALGRRLSADPDWRRRPAEAGSDAWLLAKALGGDARVAQSWLGAWPRPAAEPEEPAQTLARALGLVFLEMERDADRWQRIRGARPVQTFGEASYETARDRLDPARLVEAFSLGLRDLHPIWSLVLPPASLMSLQRAAASPVETFELPDALWARVIFDFAVAHMTRVVERRQLLRSLTPLYMGWLAGLARAASTLDDEGFEARLAAVGKAFEQEKRYLIGRWRWPDDFNP